MERARRRKEVLVVLMEEGFEGARYKTAIAVGHARQAARGRDRQTDRQTRKHREHDTYIYIQKERQRERGTKACRDRVMQRRHIGTRDRYSLTVRITYRESQTERVRYSSNGIHRGKC